MCKNVTLIHSVRFFFINQSIYSIYLSNQDLTFDKYSPLI